MGNKKKPNPSDHVISFVEALHLCGDYNGTLCKLRPFQKEIFARTFNGKVRRALWLLPRKHSKTWMAAACCLYSLLCRGNNQVVISAAASQAQAKRIHDAMAEIIRQDEELSELCTVYKDRIICERNFSFYHAVTSGSGHGWNATTVVLDEYHEMVKPNHRNMVAALTTGRGARKAPLTIIISTQSASRTSLAYEEFTYALKTKNRIENGELKTDGTIDNPFYFAALYYSTLEDNWHDRTLWHKIAPALGDFVDTTEYEEQYQLACAMPSASTSFRQLYLNCPMDHRNKWMDMARWAACETKDFPDDETLAKYPAYASLDLAPVDDLSCLCLLWDIDGKLYIKVWAWCPEQNIAERTRLERVPYEQWKEMNHITATDGNSTDFNWIERDIIELNKRYQIKKLVADQAHANILCTNLQAEGIETDWFRQGFLSMGPATARLEKLVLDKQLQYQANPVLTYCIGNVICERDAADNIKPSNKLRARHEKIDAAVALIMCVGIWLGEQAQVPSIYETQKPLIF